MMRDVPLMVEMTRRIVEAVKKPVTVKTRLGWDEESKNIEEIGGTLSIDSTPGQGTAITLKIPLTLAIIDGMKLKVGDACYTIDIAVPIPGNIDATPDANSKPPPTKSPSIIR
jgi:hypothetical protein